MIRRVCLTAAFVALAAAAGIGQQQPPPSLETPTFKAEVEYVEVDALVTDAQGRFIRDLTKDDFQVFEDGQRQTISTFTLVDLPIERAERPLFAEAPVEPDVRSNERQFDGRVYVVILDDLHTDAHRTTQVKLAMRQFIERNLGANDLMAVVHTGGRTDAAQEFTSNKRLLLASVDKFMGRKLVSATLRAQRAVLPAARRGACGFADRRSRRTGARLQRAVDDAIAEGDRRVAQRPARPAQDDHLRERGDRLRHHRRHPPVRCAEQLGVCVDRRHPPDDQRRGAVERRHLRHRSARADRR